MSTSLGGHELLEQLEGDELSVLWKARDIRTGQLRLVEILDADVAKHPAVADAFVEAVETVARLGARRHLPRALAAARDPATGRVYSASDFATGATVATQLGGGGALPWERVATIVEGLAAAVGVLHEQHRWHGQLHPRHLLIPADSGTDLVLRGLGRGAILERVPEAVRLQVHPYAAPEQLGWTPAGATPATDVWSLGLIALTLLTGAAPAALWDARSTTELAHRIAHHPPLRPSGVSLDWSQRLPTGFDDWFARCVSTEPAHRFPSFALAARQLVALLQPAAHHQRGAADPFARAEPPTTGPGGPPARSLAQRSDRDDVGQDLGSNDQTGGRDRTTTYVVAGVVGALLVTFLVLVAAAGAGVWWYLAMRDERADDPAIAGDPDTAETDDCPAEHAGTAIPVTAADPSWGNPLAPVTIVQFSDLECPFCARVESTIDELQRDYGPEQLRLVWKHNPLPFHKNAAPAQEASVAVFQAGGGGPSGSRAFFAFCDLAFANRASLNPDNYAKWAVEAGVPVAKFNAELRDPRTRKKVEEDMALARQLGARGTPAFRINGVELAGAQPVAKFKAVIDDELKAARDLVDSGTPPKFVYVRRVAANHGSKPPPAPTSKSQPTPPDDTIWKVPVAPDDPAKGPADALVTIVEWSDFQCPFCKRVAPTLDQVLAKYPRDVRLVWKDNPLPFHPRALPAAVLGRVAFEQQGSVGFWKAHDALFANQSRLEDHDLATLCARLGIGWPAVQRGIANGPHRAKIDASMEVATDLQARGTPHFFINGYRVKGAQPLDKFDEIVRARLAAARSLVAGGTPRSEVYTAIMRAARGPDPLETRTVAAPSPSSPSRGAANAPVVIQVFSEFQCPFCKRVLPTLQEIERKYPGQVRIVWRNLPLEFHKNAALAAEAAHEAFVQRGNAGFWRFHDRLFAVQSEAGALERPGLERIAMEQGLDLARFRNALDARTHRAHVEADVRAARSAQIKGTPSFVINRYFVAGAQPFPAFKKRIDAALRDGR